MANKKTSARSKGYRKTEKKKPFLTKKEIIWLVAIVAAIALALVLFNLLYDDGSLEVSEGVVQTENLETSLILNDGSSDAPKYFKLGEAGQIEGYARERVENSVDANLASYSYVPEQAQEGAVEYSISAGNGTPQALLQVVLMSSLGENYAVTSISETEVNGRQFVYYISTNHYTSEETGVTTCTQNLSAYAQSPLNDDYSVIIHVRLSGESAEEMDEEALAAFTQSVYRTEEELLADLEKAVPAVFADGEQ